MSDEITLRLPASAVAHWQLGSADPDDSDRLWPAEYCGPDGPWASDEEHVGPGCGKPVTEDEPVRKMRGWWLHADCARAAITAADVDEAWLLIADQVAARPHKFRASEIRTVLNAVSAIASRALPVRRRPDLRGGAA